MSCLVKYTTLWIGKNMKNKNPLIDVAVILIGILATVAVGHYYIAKKERETSLQNVEEPVESRTQKMIPPVVDLSRFEAAVKYTE